MRDTGSGKNQGHRLTRDQAEGLFDEADVDHNGSIDVQSMPGEGSTFSMELVLELMCEEPTQPQKVNVPHAR